tara:strand:+ start:253 stop:1332 length:1080 start_codon:yes stop_codon:yes gene_type:complete
MRLEELSLTNYKNIDSRNFIFKESIICLVGENGVGKSNILNSIYHLCFGKSFVNNSSVSNIKFGTKFYMIQGIFSKNNLEEKLNFSHQEGNKRIFKRNGKLLKKISDHIGQFPLVLISPYDVDIINGGSLFRRNLMDSIIVQTDKKFLRELIDYNKILAQRNALLKINQKGKLDHTILEIYDEKLIETGNIIYEKRKSFMKIYAEIFKSYYLSISDNKETVKINYKSQLEDNNFRDLVKKSLERDLRFQFTTKGPHKDDLDFLLNGFNLKKYASQGQQKSLLISLKLAQYEFLEKDLKLKPLILLDDIFDKLDQKRVELIMQLIEDNYFGQIFITDTDKNRVLKAIKTTKLSYKIHEIF